MKSSPVTKPLGSVKKICQASHTVVCDDEGSFIMNKNTGEVNWLREEDGNFMLDAWIPHPQHGSVKTSHRCKPQIQTQQGRGCVRRGRRRTRGHGTRDRTAMRALDKFRPKRKYTIESGPRPWRPAEGARRSQRNAHTLPLLVSNLLQSERKEAHRNGGGKERSCKATISFDFKTFGQEDDRDDKATAIMYKENHTKMISGHVCERKGESDTWVTCEKHVP